MFSIFFDHFKAGCFVDEGINNSMMDASFSISFIESILQLLFSFLRTLLSLVLIRNLDMKFDYVLFHNSCNSNVCPFVSQTCCQSMKNPKRQLGPSFEDFFSSCKIQGLSQRE